MGLLVWLPLNGDLNNQGLGTVTHISGTPTYKTNGKIGSYCCDLNTQIRLRCNELNGLTKFTIMFWVKIEDNNNLTSNWNKVFMISEEKADNSATGLLRCETCYGSSYGATSHARGTHWHDNTNYAITDYSPSMYTSADRGIWHHVTFAVDTDNGAWAYTDGNQIGSSTTVYGGHLKTDFYLGDTNNISGCINDVRIYDNALSPKEIKEISKGLVLHYPLSRVGGDNLLSHYVSAGGNNPSSTATGGRTQYYGDYGIIISATENADTYFSLFLAEQLTQNKTYTISCNASGLLSGTFYNFPLFTQSNGAMGYLKIDHNGLCSLTFTMTYDTQTEFSVDGRTVYRCFMDDGTRNLASGQGAITLTNFKIEEGDKATPWLPNKNETAYIKAGFNNNIEYDVSGYRNNGIKVGNITYDADTPRYQTSTHLASGANYINCGRGGMVTDAITVNLWIKATTIDNPISCTEGGGWNFENSSGYIQFPLYISGVGYVPVKSSDVTFASLKNSGWHMLTGTYDRVNVKLYIDGILNATATPSSGNNIGYNANNVIFIGCEAAGNATTPASTNFVGNISDVRIYTTALSADDILALYNTPVSIANNGTLMTQGEISEV